MITDYISHEEATIQSFMRDPEYADYYLQSVLEDGDAEEIKTVQGWYDEAKLREQEARYWSEVLEQARQAAQTGHNLRLIYSLLLDATSTVKSAMA